MVSPNSDELRDRWRLSQNRCKNSGTKIAVAVCDRFSGSRSSVSISVERRIQRGTDFVMGRRTTRSHQVRERAHSMRLLPGHLTWSESARGRCGRSFGLARCGLQAGSRGAAYPASTHQRAVHPRGGHRRDTGQPVCVKVRYRVRRAHGRAAGPPEPAPPPEHTRHFKPAIRAL